ncbi:hypothetical protein [Hyphomicrobium sp. DY-1]|uniref:hypothetical protein n=1 Tax=Hyphomicrobium sp. DY-1 TaxID=3075650 RepID=UPI0039C3B4B1
MDLLEKPSVLDDFSDFGDEFAELMAMEIADAALVCGKAAGEITLIDAIETAWRRSNGENAQPEYSPNEIGQLPGYSRASAIRSAEAYAMSSVGRQPMADRINSRLIGPLLHHIALWSDNPYGRCTIGSQRHADYIGCSDRQCRSLIIQVVNDGIVKIKPRPGLPPALWLRYPHVIIAASPMQISEAIAPPRRSPGRPSSVEKPRKSSVPEDSPTSDRKPRNSYVPGDNTDDQKTPEVKDENPGSLIDKPRNHSASDCKNSLQDLNKQDDSEEREEANLGSPSLDEDSCSLHSVESEVQTETVELISLETSATKRQRAAARPHELPGDWDPGADGFAYAIERGLSEDNIRHEWENFRDHHIGKRTKWARWDLAWQKWVRNAIEFRNNRKGRGRASSEEIAAQAFGGSSWERS